MEHADMCLSRQAEKPPQQHQPPFQSQRHSTSTTGFSYPVSSPYHPNMQSPPSPSPSPTTSTSTTGFSYPVSSSYPNMQSPSPSPTTFTSTPGFSYPVSSPYPRPQPSQHSNMQSPQLQPHFQTQHPLFPTNSQYWNNNNNGQHQVSTTQNVHFIDHPFPLPQATRIVYVDDDGGCNCAHFPHFGIGLLTHHHHHRHYHHRHTNWW